MDWQGILAREQYPRGILSDDMNAMTHRQLSALRQYAPSLLDQQMLAPAEHRAFAREYSAENPVRALGLVAAIPAYQAAKGLGIMGSRTGTSQPVDQMFAGYEGLLEGLAQAMRAGLVRF